MKNYIINKVHEHELDLRKSLLEKYMQAGAVAGGDFGFNTITGTIDGEGEVKNSYVFGTVHAAKDSSMIGCVVDENVTVILEEGAEVRNCHFRGINNSGRYPELEMHIGAGSIVFDSIILVPILIGKGCILDSVNASWSYNLVEDKSNEELGLSEPNIVIGDRTMISIAVLSVAVADLKHLPKIELGTDIIIVRSSISTFGKLTIKSGAVFWHYILALKFVLGESVDNKRLDINQHYVPQIDQLVDCNKFHLEDIDCTVGTNFYYNNRMRFSKAYRKAKTPALINIEDNVSFVSGNDDMVFNKLCVHNMQVGSNSLLLFIRGMNGYEAMPKRNLIIGKSSCVVAAPQIASWQGNDKYVPDNSTSTL